MTGKGGDERLGDLKYEQLMRDDRSSASSKYRKVVLGDSSLPGFVWYELLTTFFGPVPGALGLAMRRLLYPSLLGKCGKGVVFGYNTTLRHPGKIELGPRTVVDDLVVLSARGSERARITIGNGVLLGRGAHLRVKEGVIEVGDRSRIGPFSFVGTTQRIRIESDVTTGPLCTIGLLTKEDDDPDVPNTLRGSVAKGGVILGQGVALGGSVVVMDGVTIGGGSVIGAGSVVTKDIPEGSVAVGVPARVIRKRHRDELDVGAAVDG